MGRVRATARARARASRQRAMPRSVSSRGHTSKAKPSTW